VIFSQKKNTANLTQPNLCARVNLTLRGFASARARRTRVLVVRTRLYARARALGETSKRHVPFFSHVNWHDTKRGCLFGSLAQTTLSISSYLWNELSELTLLLFAQFIATQVTILKEFPYFQVTENSLNNTFYSQIICFGRPFQIHQLTQCLTLNAPCVLWFMPETSDNVWKQWEF